MKPMGGIASMVRLALPAVLFLIGRPTAAWTAEEKDVSITVYEGEEQTFQGLGGSCTNSSDGYQPQSAATRTGMATMVWKDADMRVLRLWAKTNQSAAEFAGKFKMIIDDAKKVQPELILLLGPTGVASGRLQSHCAHYAQMIKELKDNHGIHIDATGVTNEPNAHNEWLPNEAAAGVKTMRAELDSRGLTDVKLIAPEVSNVDPYGISYIENIIADPAAVEAIDGFSTHSYSMCMTKALRDLERAFNKEHWQTESSGNGPEDLNNYQWGCDVAARIISDINLGITHWCYFIAYEGYAATDNRTRILYFNVGGGDYHPLYKYYYMKDIGLAFTPGTVMRTAESDLDWMMDWYNDQVDEKMADSGDARLNYFIWDDRMIHMEQTYGVKCPINLAAGRRPDGRWAIGITNTSGYCAPLEGDTGCWVGGISIPTLTLNVTVRVEELSGVGELQFDVWRTNGDVRNEPESAVTMTDGMATVTVDQYDLLTLVSKVSVDPVAARSDEGSGLAAARITGIDARADSPEKVTVRYTLDRDGERVRLAVYDTKGRLVRELVDGHVGEGDHFVTWIAPPSSGVFLLVIESGQRRASTRLVRGKDWLGSGG